jgi:exodeoxyribonuclease VII large subunit
VPTGEVRPFTLTRLSSEIARSLAPIGRVAVPGEVAGNPSVYTSGAYFTLKDRQFVLSVHVPGRNLRRSHLVPGERVEVTGTLIWQPGHGRLQLVAEEVVPVGAGAVSAMVEAARRRLAADGILDRPRRGLPLLPALIGVVCGSDAAVRHDIASVVDERFPGFTVRYQECTVTGPGAAASIVEAVGALLAEPAVEVIILARGGGDATQLLPWSDEELCRAVAASPIPIVAAIGHEEDRPLVDEVADMRCGTPSIAAARVVPRVDDLRTALDGALARAAGRVAALLQLGEHRLARIDVRRSLDDGVVVAARRLERAGDRLAATHPARALELAEARLARCDVRRPMRLRVDHAAARLAAAEARLADLGPGQVLRRGYAVVRGPDGRVVRNAERLHAGDRITVDVSDGRFSAVVESAMLDP